MFILFHGIMRRASPICNLGKATLESIFIISLYMNPTSKSSDNSWEKISAPVPVTSDGKPISIHPAPPGWKPGHGPPPAPPSSPGHDEGSGVAGLYRAKWAPARRRQTTRLPMGSKLTSEEEAQLKKFKTRLSNADTMGQINYLKGWINDLKGKIAARWRGAARKKLRTHKDTDWVEVSSNPEGNYEKEEEWKKLSRWERAKRSDPWAAGLLGFGGRRKTRRRKKRRRRKTRGRKKRRRKTRRKKRKRTRKKHR